MYKITFNQIIEEQLNELESLQGVQAIVSDSYNKTGYCTVTSDEINQVLDKMPGFLFMKINNVTEIPYTE